MIVCLAAQEYKETISDVLDIDGHEFGVQTPETKRERICSACE